MKKPFSILMICALAFCACADQDEIDQTFFHPAASLFIQGDATSSSNLVAKGLSLFPDDAKLLRLKKLLEQQQENEEQQNQDDQQNQENQDQNQEQQNQDQQNQDQQDEQQQPPKQEPDQQDEQSQEEQQPQQPEPQTADQMSEEEAKQLLDAMKQEEENKRLQLHPVRGAPVPVDKDW